MLYLFAFDVADDKSFGTITLATAGKSNAVVTFSALSATTGDGTATTTLWTHTPEAVGDFTGEDADETELCASFFADSTFATVLQTALRAAATTSSWTSPSNITVAYSTATNAYTIAYSTANFTLTFSTDAGAALLGYTNTSHSGAQTYTSTLSPDYTVDPTLERVSGHTANFEIDGIATQSVGGGGVVFGMARSSVPIGRNWTQQFEAPEKVLREEALSTHPFTFQEGFERSRTFRPFIVSNGFGLSYREAFILRAEGASWKPQYAADNWSGAYHISFITLQLGRGS